MLVTGELPPWMFEASADIVFLAGIAGLLFIAIVMWEWVFERILVLMRLKRDFIQFVWDKHRPKRESDVARELSDEEVAELKRKYRR